MQMPTTMKTICLFCGEYVEDKQIKKNKAICEDCDISVYCNVNTKPIKSKTISEDRIRKMKKIERDLKNSCKETLRSRGLPRDKGNKFVNGIDKKNKFEI